VGPGQSFHLTPYETSWSIIILKDLILGGLASFLRLRNCFRRVNLVKKKTLI
jgi:hypothetical protein